MLSISIRVVASSLTFLGSPPFPLILVFTSPKGLKHPRAEVGKVSHAKGTPQNRPQAVVVSLGLGVGRAAHEVIGDLVHPPFQGPGEGTQGRQPEVFGAFTPGT